MMPHRWRVGTATRTLAVLLAFGGVLLAPLSSDAQGFGRILGGAVGGTVLGSGTALGSDRRFVIVQPRLAIAEARRAGSVTQLSLDRDGNLLFVVLADGSARWWDIDRGLERGAVGDEGIVAGRIRGSGLGADILAVRSDGSSVRFRLDGSRHPGSESILGFDRAARFTTVAASGAMAFRMRDGRWWLSTADGERLPLPDAAGDALPVFSADGYKVAYRIDQGRALRVMRLGNRRLEPLGLLSGCSNAARITAARFTPAGGRIVLGDAGGNLCLWDISGGSAPRLLFSVRTALSDAVRALALDREGRRAAAGNGREAVEIWPIAGRIERASSVTLQMRAVGALALDSERGWLLAGGENGTVAIHDIGARERRSRPIARLISTRDGWSVLDSAGRFDGSQNGIDALSWVGEAQEGGATHELPVDSFSESHYEPGLLAKLDGPGDGLLSDAAPDIPQSGYIRPAAVTIDIGEQDAQGRLAVTVRSESGYPSQFVAGLRLYHNGKLVLAGESGTALETSVRLVAGENRISAVAVGPNGVEGGPATRIAMRTGVRTPARLNVLAIGINDYAKPAWELFRSRNDAETMVSALRDRGTRLLGESGRPAFGSVRAETLLDKSARKDAIEDLILRSPTDAEDVLVLYFAGHGYALKDKDEGRWDWYLLPYTREWRRRTATPDEYEGLIRQHGLSARRLMSLLTRTAAQRVFLVLDSCYSGAVVEAVEGMVAPSPGPGDDAATQKVLRQIARIGGLHVLAASRAHEKATELQLEPHGALTYLVLEGLSGVADVNGDRGVTVREVIDYATAEMPNLADKLSQQPISQRPLGYSKGANFTIAGL